MKRVLLASHHFPPDTAVGAIRASKFAKYLPRSGWEPVVLTVKKEYYPSVDALVDNEPPYPVIRSGFVRNQSYYYRKLKRLIFGNAIPTPSRTPSTGNDAPMRPSLRDWINALTAFPDEDTGWLPFAY
jgi:hypothetical protein